MKLKKINNSGFTLVESLVSILLLSIILTGGIALYHNAEELMARAVHKNIATQIANASMEEMKSQAYSTLVDGTTVSTMQVGELIATETVTITGIDVRPPGGDGNIDFKQIDLDLTWREAGKQTDQLVQLSTYIAP